MNVEIETKLVDAAPIEQYLNFIPVVDCELPYNSFFQDYLLKNQACVIKNSSNDWLSSKQWVNSNGLNFDYLYSYGNSNVMVYDCDEKYYNSQKTNELKFMNYLIYWESYIESNYSKDFPLLYLKDWHLQNSIDDMLYEVPLHFTSDWLNEYLVDMKKDDYRFVYMGPKGSWTPFHADVFKSYSWSVNIYGQKRWILLPPGEENLLKNSLGALPYDISNVLENVKHFEIIQNPGDAIFVPTGWHHQVWNLKDTISINHNWINGVNIKEMWSEMEYNLACVKKEIGDCSDMDNFSEQVQRVLKASFGLDLMSFYEFLKYIADKRLQYLLHGIRIILHQNYELGRNHALFDLKCISSVLKIFCTNEDVKELSSFSDDSSPSTLLNTINEFLENG